MAAIATSIAGNPVETDFERGVRKFGYLLTRVMMVMVILVFTVNMLLHRPLIESLLFAVALAVGLTPELLPAIVSVTLSAGARRMAKNGVLVRRLEAIENLGDVDILCTDKTGTLTQGVVELNAAVDVAGAASERVFRLAARNSHLEAGIENPLDTAIVVKADKESVETGDAIKLDEIPYDFVCKRLTIVVRDDGAAQPFMITKGAFDNVLSCCTRIAGPNGASIMDDAEKQRIQSFFEEKSAQGYRVLGVATRQVEPDKRYSVDEEAGMTYEGFLLFFDPLKEDVQSNVEDLASLGIGTKIISGDNRFVAAHVGEAVGLDASRLLTARELNQTRDEALWHLAPTIEECSGSKVNPRKTTRGPLRVIGGLGGRLTTTTAPLPAADEAVSKRPMVRRATWRRPTGNDPVAVQRQSPPSGSRQWQPGSAEPLAFCASLHSPHVRKAAGLSP